MRANLNPPPPRNFRWNNAQTSQSFSGLKKIARSRPHSLLEAACKVVNATFGGFGFLSAVGEMVENPAWGVSDEIAEQLSRSPWLAELIRVVLQQARPMRVADLQSENPFGPVPANLPPPGPFLAVPLARPGRLRGALYLVRSPGQPTFTAEDEERVLPIIACLEQGTLFEEAHLQAQLRLLNQVAQAAAGNLDLAPILDVALRELDRHLPMTICAVWVPEHDNRGEGSGVREQRSEVRDQRSEVREQRSELSGQGTGTSDLRPLNSDVILRLADKSKGQSQLARKAGLAPGTRVALAQTPFEPCWRDGGAIYADWSGPAHPADSDEGSSVVTLGLHCTEAIFCFATPLRAGDRTVGVLQCITNRPTGFTSEQVQILYLVADLLGPAISNCQLYGRLKDTYEALRATQEQLIRNEKMRAIGELASGMAHNFNNSLCGVLGFVEMALMDRGLSSGCRSQLEMARTCALDAAQTVRRVQDFARKRSRAALFQPLDLNKFVKETVELTRPKWESLERSRGKPIMLELLTDARQEVMGNAAELREALMNLVFNAVDAMPQGGTLSVRTWSRGPEVFVSVRDTGLGMIAEVQQRLFEPFFTTKGEHGNGMGLSVTFGIIRQHGGDITVASEINRGSEFTIRLPAAGRDEGRGARGEGRGIKGSPVLAMDPLPSPVAPRPTSAGGGLRVLVVEDEEPICRFLATVLTTLGHRPQVVQTAAAALRLFDEQAFDVVITDLGLPDRSGEEVARAMAEHVPGIPIVLLTGWADQIANEAKPMPGVTRVLGKPVAIEHLAETLRSVCRQRSS
jgi:signal transduction histidine kinase/CheY-like chemotaxis protein